MLEITGDDIALLSDEDLRSLIGRLCEAELRKRGLSPSAVTWGGNQTAKDGGLDVRVALPAGTAIVGFIPRAATGFQVKKSDMPPSSIGPEMKPKGVLRSVIAELAKESGAYIIVSGSGSTADSALTDRRKAMADAVSDQPDAAKLGLDFLDRNRIATWVREHAGMVLWVRARIGKSIARWRPHGPWAHRPSEDADYLIDDTARIRTTNANDGNPISAIEGIAKIREALRQPGQVVRLVGLSGIGKTRLAEALFDSRIGTNALDPALAVYTNVAEGPDPQPSGLASDLVAMRTRAILVIDNCPPDLHRHLSEIARAPGSTISVITVEYDIRDDKPEGTDVFELEPSSLDLIAKLIAARFRRLSQIDAQTIAEFSGGNARIAIALAETVRPGESIKGLSDAELFKRLFEQRHGYNEPLEAIAQAVSLVYSFDGENTEGEDAEMAVLGRLVGKSAAEVFRAVTELRRRDLAQKRSEWRAVLPHAIANRLAATALENIPRALIRKELIEGGSPRLLRSLSRRLGYLDGSREAEAIVESWLSPGGLLADIPRLSGEQRAMLTNIAPVAPDAVLAAIESVLAKGDPETLNACRPHIGLLRSLAYDPALFDRAVAALLKFAAAEADDSNASNAVVSLFYVLLSGTHAPVEQRLRCVEALLSAPEERLRKLGLKALEAMMRTEQFSSGYSFEFGARSRDYGWVPAGPEQIAHWFGAVLGVAETFALSETQVTTQVRKAIANEFRGLWVNARQFDELERIAKAVAAKGFWRDGWVAARQALRLSGERTEPEILARLAELEKHLRPKDLLSQVRGVVLGSAGAWVDVDDLEAGEEYDDAAKRVEKTIARLGTDVAHHPSAFAELLPELVESTGKLPAFGHALARAADEPAKMWEALVDAFAKATRKNTQVLSGFLNALQERDPSLCTAMLDGAVRDPVLAEVFPVLQANVLIGEVGAARLHHALAQGKAPLFIYGNLAGGRVTDSIPGPVFRDLILAIGQTSEGFPVALEILSMRIFVDKSEKRASLPETLEAGRKLLARFEMPGKNAKAAREDHDLQMVTSACLGGAEGLPVAASLCLKLREAIDMPFVSVSNYADTLAALFKLHPSEMLDTMFAGDEKTRQRTVRNFIQFMRHRHNPLRDIPDDTLLTWCDDDAGLRYPLITAIAPLFKRPKEDVPEAWLPLTAKLLQKAPDPVAVLAEIVRRLQPTSWNGSLATKLEGRLALLEQLDTSASVALAQAASEAAAAMRKQIEAQRQQENERERESSGRFE